MISPLSEKERSKMGKSGDEEKVQDDLDNVREEGDVTQNGWRDEQWGNGETPKMKTVSSPFGPGLALMPVTLEMDCKIAHE